MFNGVLLRDAPSYPPVSSHHVFDVQPAFHHFIQARIEVVDRVFRFVQIIELEFLILRRLVIESIPERASIIMKREKKKLTLVELSISEHRRLSKLLFVPKDQVYVFLSHIVRKTIQFLEEILVVLLVDGSPIPLTVIIFIIVLVCILAGIFAPCSRYVSFACEKNRKLSSPEPPVNLLKPMKTILDLDLGKEANR